MLLKFFRRPAFERSVERQIMIDGGMRLRAKNIGPLATEVCFYVGVTEELNGDEHVVLRWLLAETFEPSNTSASSFLSEAPMVLEVGPRLNFETPFSSNALSIFKKCGLGKIYRIEKSVRYGLGRELDDEEAQIFLKPLHDRMTQQRYVQPLTDFGVTSEPAPVRIVPLLEQGISSLHKENVQMGLAMDEQDEQMWFDLFVNVLKRNPTDVELFQIGQANSEHCRHGWFKGIHVIDGKIHPRSPMDIVREPWERLNGKHNDSIIAFHDNSSAIKGRRVDLLVPKPKKGPGDYALECGVLLHPTLTAETHNHPSGVEPYEGAATGGGGRIRDDQAVGRGGYPLIAGTGYCTGNLHIPGYELPWENDGRKHPANLASPLEIMIQASNGAFDYGNCFGEPVIYGFTRTFGMQLPKGYRAWYKPIMYSVGGGTVRDEHVRKDFSSEGQKIVLLGGPAYRIGIGGGSASSLIAGANEAELDFASVQRGDPEMANRVNRVIRTCVNMGKNNPIRSIHDLGAGGTCNALPEIANPVGAAIDLRAIPVGDKSLSTLEIWGNESQERNVVLVDEVETLAGICKRENCPMAVVGEIIEDGAFILYDDNESMTPVCLPLDKILGKLPQKTFRHTRVKAQLEPLQLPDNLTVEEALQRVLRLPSVASKRWLTNKVDRSVTGLVAQQQCVGPGHTPIADYAVRADSHFGLSGAAMSLGEQPIKGLIDPKAMGRLAVSEALLNLCGAKVKNLGSVRCSANWMWAAKLEGEGPKLIDAAEAARDIMIELGMAIDGGKDSLSMAAKALRPDGTQEVVKAPGELVIATYASMSDITKKVTPDLKSSDNLLVLVEINKSRNRLGGSALAQVYGQIGHVAPDVDDPGVLKTAFEVIQELVEESLVESVHDRSDGGLIVALLEMAFAGNAGIDIDLSGVENVMPVLFSEEPGIVLEIKPENSSQLYRALVDLPYKIIGNVSDDDYIHIDYNGEVVLDEPMIKWRQIWEETSYRLDREQANPETARQEWTMSAKTSMPYCRLSFTPQKTNRDSTNTVQAAVLREEGTNGDWEMAATLHMAGFETKDVNMTDLIEGNASLNEFKFIVAPGGFTFKDTFDAGKGWAGVVKFNPEVASQFEEFRQRPGTLSLGVCNGCQFMALLGWIPGYDLPDDLQPRFIRNTSGRFESRFSTVRIYESPAIMLQGMEGSALGVWVAHGEGRMHCKDPDLIDRIMYSSQAPLRYVDAAGKPTEGYPYNPNGSPFGIAGLCSEDGRHLAMMPHPERTTLKWQWPWMPPEWNALEVSPWLKMFQNAFEWCQKH